MTKVSGWCHLPLINRTRVVAGWSRPPPPSTPCPSPGCPRGPAPPWLMCHGLQPCRIIWRDFTSGKLILKLLQRYLLGAQDKEIFFAGKMLSVTITSIAYRVAN